MSLNKMSKEEFKVLQRTKLGGTDGDLYLEVSMKRILKVLHHYSLYQGVGDKIRLLERLMRLQELKGIAAIPEEIDLIEFLKRWSFWMHYYQNGVKLDVWTRQNQSHSEKVLKVYKKISENLKLLHEEYGIIVSDCYYGNILIVEDEIPIFVDVDSWSMEDIKSYTVSRILYDYSLRMRWNKYQQSTFLQYSYNADKTALWLMYFESVLGLPVRKWSISRFPDLVKRETKDPFLLELTKLVSDPFLPEVPYLHELETLPYTLHK